MCVITCCACRIINERWPDDVAPRVADYLSHGAFNARAALLLSAMLRMIGRMRIHEKGSEREEEEEEEIVVTGRFNQ
jgi:hypothetical protein